MFSSVLRIETRTLYMLAKYSTTKIHTQLHSDTRHHASDISFTRSPGSDIHTMPIFRSGGWVAVFKSQCLNLSTCTWPLSWLSSGDHLLNFLPSPVPSLPTWTTSVSGASFLRSPLSLVDAYSVISWTCFHHGYGHHLTTYTGTGSGRPCWVTLHQSVTLLPCHSAQSHSQGGVHVAWNLSIKVGNCPRLYKPSFLKSPLVQYAMLVSG